MGAAGLFHDRLPFRDLASPTRTELPVKADRRGRLPAHVGVTRVRIG